MKNPRFDVRTARRGFSFVEIAIAILILALGLLPILSMMASGSRQSAFSEYHLFASNRAHRIAEELLTYSSANFEQLQEGGAGLASLVRSVTAQETAFPREYTAKLAPGSYREEVTVEPLDDGLVMLKVQIHWAFPTDAPESIRSHVFTHRRVMARPDVSFTEELPLADTPAPVS